MAPPIEDRLIERDSQPRSFFGNHSATAFVAPGQFADSPHPEESEMHRTPETARKRCEHRSDGYQTTVSVSPLRVPNTVKQSSKVLTQIAYATRKEIDHQSESSLLPVIILLEKWCEHGEHLPSR